MSTPTRPRLRTTGEYPISEEELAMLGEISFHMAVIEYSLHKLLWHLLGLDEEKGLLVTGPLQLNQKTELLQALVKNMETKDEKLNEVTRLIERVRPERNRKVHAFWVWAGPERERSAMLLAKDRRSFKFEPVTTADIAQARDEVFTVSGLLATWLDSKGLLHAQPAKS